MSVEDEPTQFGTPDSPRAPSYWNIPVPENNSAPTPPPQKKRKTPVGIVTALIAVVAVLSVALVVLIMKQGSSGSVASSTKTSAPLTQKTSSSSGPMNSAAALNTNSNAALAPTATPSQATETASSNSTSTSDTTAAFPVGSRSVCGSDTNDTDTQLYPLTNPRVRIGSAFANSCGFVAEVARDVDNQVAANPSLPSFSPMVQTPRNKSWHNLQCNRVNHLSTCVVDGKSDHLIYVQDK